jgi:hypothetical protein
MQRLLFLLLASQALLTGQTLVDEKTAFMWQDVVENKSVILTWEEAKENCEALDLEDFDDWWLPSESEMATIVDMSRPAGRRIKKGFVYYKKNGTYWTASTYAWNAPHAWAVDFGSGASYTLPKEQRRFVRCVRCSDFKKCIELFYNR